MKYVSLKCQSNENVKSYKIGSKYQSKGIKQCSLFGSGKIKLTITSHLINSFIIRPWLKDKNFPKNTYLIMSHIELTKEEAIYKEKERMLCLAIKLSGRLLKHGVYIRKKRLMPFRVLCKIRYQLYLRQFRCFCKSKN